MTALGDFSSGDVLTAADLNAIGTWTDYTATFGGITAGNGTVNYSHYVQLNNLVIAKAQFTLGSTSSVTGLIDISLPVTASEPSGEPQVTSGYGRIFDSSTSSVYWCVPYIVSTTQARIYVTATTSTYAYRANTSATVPMSWSTNDSIQAVVIYQVD